MHDDNNWIDRKVDSVLLSSMFACVFPRFLRCFLPFLIFLSEYYIYFFYYPGRQSSIPPTLLCFCLRQFVAVEAVITGFVDQFDFLRAHKTLFTLLICVVGFLLGLSMCTPVIMDLFTIGGVHTIGNVTSRRVRAGG